MERERENESKGWTRTSGYQREGAARIKEKGKAVVHVAFPADASCRMGKATYACEGRRRSSRRESVGRSARLG
eukprot:12906926-Prorocentrum_lima.AAC.1